jgi:hypothetical protein
VAHPAASHERALRPAYERRRLQETVVYRTLAAHWAEFCERAEEADGLPCFVHPNVHTHLLVLDGLYIRDAEE